MIVNLLEKKELLTYILYLGLFLFVLNRASGLANLLRFLFRYLKINYSDRKMKSLDDQWFNIQLFKIINRINVSKIEDARIIQKGLNDGALKASSFYFTSSWGDITIAMPLYRKILAFMMGTILIGLGAIAWYGQEPIVDGYAKFNFDKTTYYVSKDRLIIVPDGGDIKYAAIHSKQDCRNAMKYISETSIFAMACTKLLDESESYQWWLDGEIKSIHEAKSTLTMLMYVYITLGVIWLLSAWQFIRAGEKVRKYKVSVENAQ